MARNHTNRLGEIDIIAKKEKIIIFIEVKSQEGSYAGLRPERSVDLRKQQKIIRAAEWYLLEGNYPATTHWRIDVIGVELNMKSRRANLRHLTGAVSL